MRHLLPLVLLFSPLLAACGGDRIADDASWTSAPEAADFAQAMPLAQAAYEEAEKGPGPYRLIGMEQFLTSEAILWRATWKPESLLPDGPNEFVGAGGEIFVSVNLATGETKLGYGE